MASFDPGRSLFRRLLRLYPRNFRERFMEEMLEFFREERAEASSRGFLGLCRFWLCTLTDLLFSAFRMRTGGKPNLHTQPRRFGPGGAHLTSQARRPGGGMMLDLKQGATSLRRSPGFVAFVVSTLALGVGATTAVFSVLDAVLLRPLPYPASSRMMLIGTLIRGQEPGGSPGPYSSADFLDLRADPGPFEVLVAQEGSRAVLTGQGDPERIHLARISEGYFEMFGARPALGRLLLPEDDGLRVMVLSHGFWQDRYGGDPSVLGRTLTLDGEAFQVIGALSPEFIPPEVLPGSGAAAWLPMGLSVGEPDRSSFGMGVVGRRQIQSTPDDGRAHVGRVLSDDYGPDKGANFIQGSVVVDLKEATVGAMGRTLSVALASVFFLLIIGCVNVAGLLLTRGATRQAELAIRSALGAGRCRLVGQLMGESLILGLAGGALGACVAYGAVDVFRKVTPGGLPRLTEVTVDHRALAFTLSVSLAAAILFGLVPAVRAARSAGNSVSGMARRATQGQRAARLRGALILAETALAVILTVGSGLMVHELVRLTTADPGFRPGGLVGISFRLPRSMEREEWQSFYGTFLERTQGLPGIQSSAVTTHLPYGQYALVQIMTPRDARYEGEGAWLPTVLVSRDYFSTMGIRLASGRWFSEADLRGETDGIIVNQALASRYWPSQGAIGKWIKSGAPDLEEDEGSFEIVGVIADVTAQPGQAVPEEIYRPYRAESWRNMTVVARTDPETLDGVTAGLRSLARESLPDLPVTITTVQSLFREAMARPRFYTVLFASFGALALVLAAVGIYGTTAFATRSRTREIGIRLALGADRSRVIRRMVTRSGIPVGIGVIIGLACAFGLSQLLSSFLYHVPSRDGATYVAVGLFVLIVGLTAALFPAASASRIDPATTLREEG